MSELTNILHAMERGEPQAAERLLPMVYDELKRMAAAQMAREKPGQTLQPTALVHEAWLRLNGVSHKDNPSSPAPLSGKRGETRRYFFAAAGEAMRRILIEQARRKKAEMHGGKVQRVELDPEQLIATQSQEDLLAVNEALDQLHDHDAAVAELVKLRYFVGMTIPEAAQALDISPRTADAWWAYARAWMREALSEKKIGMYCAMEAVITQGM